MADNRCRFIVIDGLDGSGKHTQTELVAERLIAEGKRVMQLTFPDYESDSSALVRMYLSGELGSNPDDVNAYAASAFYAVDRVASYIGKWGKELSDYDYVIADRYTTSNIMHQMSKLDPRERESYIEWLYDFEYNRLGVPKPDEVIFLDVTPSVSQRLLKERYHGDESKKDIHEAAFGYLLRCRECAVYAIDKLGWRVIKCDDGENMYPREDICGEIIQILKEDSNA